MKIKKILLNIVGILALVLGSVGIAIPILPTTPFVLLAAICFSVASPKMNAWLQRSKHFGSFIENYRNHTGVPKKVKMQSVAFLWCGLVISMVLTEKIWIAICLVFVGIAVTMHINSLKNK